MDLSFIRTIFKKGLKTTLLKKQLPKPPSRPYAITKDTYAARQYLTSGLLSKEIVIHGETEYPKVYLSNPYLEIMLPHEGVQHLNVSSVTKPIIGWNRIKLLSEFPIPWKLEG